MHEMRDIGPEVLVPVLKSERGPSYSACTSSTIVDCHSGVKLAVARGGVELIKSLERDLRTDRVDHSLDLACQQSLRIGLRLPRPGKFCGRSASREYAAVRRSVSGGRMTAFALTCGPGTCARVHQLMRQAYIARFAR